MVIKILTKLSSLSYLKKQRKEEPACELEDLINNNKDLILLTGNYRDFFGKLFQANKIKNFNEILNYLKKKKLKIEFILKFKDIMKMMKKIMKILF